MAAVSVEAKKEYVRKRHDHQGSVLRPRKMEIRMSESISNRLASIQGLIFRFGHKETMADLFESVLLPALETYVKPYAEKAREQREKDVQ